MSIASSLTIPSTLVTISSLSKSVSLFLFCKYVLLYPFFLDSAYKGCHAKWARFEGYRNSQPWE